MKVQNQLMEYNIQDIIAYIVADEDIEYDMAMNLFYNSETFEKLTDADTGLYRESSAYVYSLFVDEMKNGRMIQLEI